MEAPPNIRTRPTNNKRNDILKVLYETWRDDSKGQKIIGCWIGGVVAVSIWGIYIKRKWKSYEVKPPPITRRKPDSFLLKNREISEDIDGTDESKETEDDLIENEDDETPNGLTPFGDDELPSNGDRKMTDSAAFHRILSLGIPSILSPPILWGSLLWTALIWRTSAVSTVNDSIGSMGELLVNKKWKSLSFSTMDFAVKTLTASFAISTVDLLSNLLALSLRDAVTMSLSRRYGSGIVAIASLPTLDCGLLHSSNMDQVQSGISVIYGPPKQQWTILDVESAET